ncbi:hypothetical protein [Oceanispirochaeta sp.]|uniref:hypothetical protein n=1 Tax=Oceanispirochaeta sp. TaxID=2035350 RepID=UPI0026125451|nr:hypothetical protein [Oceanispirochaeta sp.]MDA3956014.1 hypothetical protein [Oceanispirochaeta sp.]
MKKLLRQLLFLMLLIPVVKPVDLHAYKILYAEQFYRLYHQHMYLYPEDTMENIHYLGMALRSDFANPLNALATITNEKEWEKYRYLFYMHVNLRLVDSYLKLGMKYDKRNAYFYNYPWKFSNLDSLDTAEECYRYALNFWEDAKEWSAKASSDKFAWMFIQDVQFWEDESYRIETKDLNYEKTIQRELDRLQRVREAFESMDENTY